MQRIQRNCLAASLAVAALASAASAQSVLILNGVPGTASATDAIQALGYTVIEGTLAPGEITAAFATYSDIEQVWIWNDGSLGNTGSPADPSLDFDADDLNTLAVFEALHSSWIFDSLAWRNSIDDPDARALTQNEALLLGSVGGGIVLGTDDSTGDLLLQHVNQVAGYFGFAPFAGAFAPDPSLQNFASTLLASPNGVAPAALFTTGSNCDVPHGVQPNGRLVHTSIYCSDAGPIAPWSNDALPSDSFAGVAVVNCLHLVTTSIDSGSNQDFVAFCFADETGTACPCGVSDPHGGCPNSTGVGGRLNGYGTSSVSADDLELEVTYVPTNVFSIIFGGSTAVSVPFGDGVRCAGGAIRRFGVHTTGPLGTFSQTNIASYAGYSAGTLSYFQAWFRDPTNACGNTTNVTNAMAVLFTL